MQEAQNNGANNTTEAGQQSGTTATTATAAESKTTETTQTEGQKQEATSESQGATAETKENEAKADEGEKQEEAKPTAPEKYEDFKMPEGVNVDTGVLEKFTGLAKELNLDQASAQKLADLGGELATKFANHNKEVVTQARAEWTKQAAADKEIGGNKFDENRATANKALAAFGTPALKTLLDESGLGDHPEVIRAFYKVGLRISEDTVVTGGDSNNAAPADAASVLFPTMKKA